MKTISAKELKAVYSCYGSKYNAFKLKQAKAEVVPSSSSVKFKFSKFSERLVDAT